MNSAKSINLEFSGKEDTSFENNTTVDTNTAFDNNASLDTIKEEIGDILFSAVNIARFFKIDPEEALGATSDKFISRFTGIEIMAAKQGKELKNMTLDEMEELYQKVKLEK